MPDRKKVIRGLECHRIDDNHRINCTDCPYYVDDDNHIRCVNDLHGDAIALLKGQEAKGQISDAIHETAKQFRQTIVRCKHCRHGKPGACGDGVDCDGVWHDDDWFCADGRNKNE